MFAGERLANRFSIDDYIAGACCDCLHYRSAALVVGVLEIIIIIAYIVFQYLYDSSYGKNNDLRFTFAWKLIVVVSLLIIILLLFVGVLTEKPFLLWPHMVGQILGITVALIFTLVSVFVMSAGEEMSDMVFGIFFGEDHIPRLEFYLGPIWPFCLAVIFNFSAAIGILFYSIVRGCYDYLQQKSIAAEASSQITEQRSSTPTTIKTSCRQ
ncbi:unnamed protein product [Soboliphyme baturini]|uniref:MARVEL domain-containing protein n=1 Tax=Soboliphyme baturini TaxID=241478 RepID=A0A183ITT6_9BILA|nr:unnamed protein product [Soboliphyme baturini]